MTTTYVRRATEHDVHDMEQILSNAKKYLKEQGINQWQGDYPNKSDIERDVKDGIAYVLDVDGQIAGTATLHLGIDVDYLHVDGGKWQNGPEGHYSSIHRIAVSHAYRGQGLATKFISGLLTISAFRGFRDVRIDTYGDNKLMQHVITSNGFTKVGTLKTSHKHPETRFAYQILLK